MGCSPSNSRGICKATAIEIIDKADLAECSFKVKTVTVKYDGKSQTIHYRDLF